MTGRRNFIGTAGAATAAVAAAVPVDALTVVAQPKAKWYVAP